MAKSVLIIKVERTDSAGGSCSDCRAFFGVHENRPAVQELHHRFLDRVQTHPSREDANQAAKRIVGESAENQA